MIPTFRSHAAWSRAVARSHAFMTSLHLETGRFDLWAQVGRMSKLDCRTCGACCVGDMDDGEGFAHVTEDDAAQMSRHANSRLVRRRVGGELYMATPPLYSEEFGKSCAFLRGTPGKRCSCGIYETRPDVCRSFAPGGKGCRWSREQLGLETPSP